MHRLIAERYLESPAEVIRFGLMNLKRWQQKGVDCEDFRIWKEILSSTPERLPEILSSLDEEAVRLRQSSPFAGLIPEESRLQILATTR